MLVSAMRESVLACLLGTLLIGLLGSAVVDAAPAKTEVGVEKIKKESMRLLDAVEKSVRDKLKKDEEEARSALEIVGNEQISAYKVDPKTVKQRRRFLLRTVELWTDSTILELTELIKAKEINEVLSEGVAIGEYYGADTMQLKKLLELGKTVIRTGDFELPNKPPPDRNDTVEQQFSTFFHKFFIFADKREREIADYYYKKQQYRLGLFKRVTLAYIRALLMLGDVPPECQSNKLIQVKFQGKALITANCPDPAVEHLRRYVNAVRQIQSADADAFLVQANEVLAQQQLTADIISAVPLVGDAIDIWSLMAGEDLTGHCMTNLDHALIPMFTVVLPFVGPSLMKGVLKRCERCAKGVESIYHFIEAANNYQQWYQGARKGEAMHQMGEQLAERWGSDWPSVKKIAKSMQEGSGFVPISPGVRAQQIMNKTLEDAARGKRAMRQLREATDEATQEVFKKVRQNANEVLEANLMQVQKKGRRKIIAASNMVADQVDVIEDYVKRQAKNGDEMIVMYRAVNGDATALIEAGFGTKAMNVKGKSADWGAHSGFIPLDQNFSKLNNPSKKMGGAERKKVEKFQKKVNEFFESLPEAEKKKFKVKLEIDNKKVMAVKGPDGKQTTLLKDQSGKYFQRDPSDSKKLIEVDSKKLNTKGEYQIEVMAAPDPDGNPVALTADYDFLAFGFKNEEGLKVSGKRAKKLESVGVKPTEGAVPGEIEEFAKRGKVSPDDIRHSPEGIDAPDFDDETGFITEKQERIMKDINREVQAKAGYTGGNVSHHGPEVNYPFSPGALAEDPRVLAIDPDFGPVEIPRCDIKCMEKWCETSGMCPKGIPVCSETPMRPCIPVDPDRLLKDYMHHRRVAGYNLAPNRVWDWGHYNPLSGWTVNGFLDSPINYDFLRSMQSSLGSAVQQGKDYTYRGLMKGVTTVMNCPRGKGAADYMDEGLNP